MKAFADLYRQLDSTTRISVKLEALKQYFQSVPPEDAVWTIWFLVGNRPRRSISTRLLREWVAERCGLPEWLLGESHEAVGDLAETLALALDTAQVLGSSGEVAPLHRFVEERVLPLARLPLAEGRALLEEAWGQLNLIECLLFHKLITGAFRIGVARTLLVRALAESHGLEEPVVAHRLMGEWQPTPEFYQQLVSQEMGPADRHRPYPFYLAHALDRAPDELGPVSDWQVERKWDGIRVQLLKREGHASIWSRGNELISESYPELMEALKDLPDGMALDGELLGWNEGSPLPFQTLQRRLGVLQPGKRLLREAPIAFMAYDLLEHNGEDLRSQSTELRRTRLEEVMAAWNQQRDRAPVLAQDWLQGDLFDGYASRIRVPLLVSPLLEVGDWQDVRKEVDRAREMRVEGVMLKHREASYGTGREKGRWWKWKMDPLTLDVVMVAAQKGHGRRAGLFTDFTFAVWQDGGLVTIAKAYSGLTDEEFKEVDAFVRANTTSRHGPIRGVKPELVFELAFEGVQDSSRHKSGVALRFPRIQRWRRDKPASEADTLDQLKALLPDLPNPS